VQVALVDHEVWSISPVRMRATSFVLPGHVVGVSVLAIDSGIVRACSG